MDDVLAVVTDLFFQARITSAARATGRRVRFVSTPDALEGANQPGLSLVDLDARTDVMEMIRALKAVTRGPVVAFGPHLDTPRMKAARAAGADRVLAKSKFTAELPRLMSQQQTSQGSAESSELEAALADMRKSGRRLEELGRLLQDPDSVLRIYFSPAPHVAEAEEHGEPIVLDSADYLNVVAVDTLEAELERIRQLRAKATRVSGGT